MFELLASKIKFRLQKNAILLVKKRIILDSSSGILPYFKTGQTARFYQECFLK